MLYVLKYYKRCAQIENAVNFDCVDGGLKLVSDGIFRQIGSLQRRKDSFDGETISETIV